ncbi:hypothetical protein LTR10_016270 [Elasticomyces elasticus]|nr:hypothetical protein LTR10_016270 [Elasticomyces elasticus]
MAAARCRSSSNPEKPGRAQPRLSSASASVAAYPVPDVPVLPPLPALPAPTWSPSLQHTPLSADPTIRALSMGVVLAQSQLQPRIPPKHRSRTYTHDGSAAVLRGTDVSTAAQGSVLGEVDGNVRAKRETAPVPPVPQKLPLPPPPLPQLPALTAPKVASMPVPPLPVRAPDHFVFPQSARPNTRHAPTPMRNRQYYNTPYVHHGTSGHRKCDANTSVSMYSAGSSSYGSDQTPSTVVKDTGVRKT